MPPVLASTPFMTAMVRRNLELPRVSMKYAAMAPGSAAMAAEKRPIFIELTKPVRYGSCVAVMKLPIVNVFSLDKNET